jgi:hypothetical protein
MSKAKLVITTCIVTFAFSAVVSASSSAVTAGWMVNGTMLIGSKAVATTAAVDEFIKIKAAGVTIECKGSTINGVAPELKSPNRGGAASLEFTACKSITANCEISSEKISTRTILLEATLEGALAIKVSLVPETKNGFATIEYDGALCALQGVQPLSGKWTMLAPTGQDERTLQLLNLVTTEASGELKVGSSAAELKGSALWRLASGESWSFL